MLFLVPSSRRGRQTYSLDDIDRSVQRNFRD